MRVWIALALSLLLLVGAATTKCVEEGTGEGREVKRSSGEEDSQRWWWGGSYGWHHHPHPLLGGTSSLMTGGSSWLLCLVVACGAVGVLLAVRSGHS